MENEVKTNEQKVWITVSKTINTGNYNNTKIDAGYTKSYSEGENPNKVIEAGIAELLAVIKKKTKKLELKAKLAKRKL